MANKETVTRVLTGNIIQTSRRKKPIHLARVDIPEKGIRAQVAKKKLEHMVLGEEVSVATTGRRDDRGYSLANVKMGRQSINRAMKTSKRPKW